MDATEFVASFAFAAAKDDAPVEAPVQPPTGGKGKVTTKSARPDPRPKLFQYVLPHHHEGDVIQEFAFVKRD